jgi:uncharacterized protein (DUF302 family)
VATGSSHGKRGIIVAYDISVSVAGDFDAVLERVREVLSEEQLTVVSEINVQQIFHTKLERDIAPYRIFGACNAKLASKIIDAEPNAGVLLPCNFVIYEQSPGMCVVSFMEPHTILGLASSDAAHEVGVLARDKITRVCEKLARVS